MNISNKKIFYINSSNRISGTTTDFSYRLDMDVNDGFTHCAYLQGIIPKSYYMVRDGKNFFTLEEQGIQTIIYIPVGNYNRKSLATVLSSILTNNSAIGYHYNVSYDNSITSGDDGKYIFTITHHPQNHQVKFIFTDNVYYIMGFNKFTTYNFNMATNPPILDSVNVIDLQLENCLYIHCNMINTPEGDDILQEIYTSGEPTFSNIYFLNNLDLECYSKQMITSSNNIYNFKITDENGLLINTNGLPIEFSIICFKKNNLLEKLKGFINLLTLKL